MVITADRSRTDGVAHSFLQQIPTDLPILLLSRSEDLDFNEQILELEGKPYVIADYIENGWQWDMEETLIVGQNTAQFPEPCRNDAWGRLHEFIRKNPPKIYFKRELLKKDVTDTIRPIDYPCILPVYPTVSKQDFDARPVSVFQYWGRSNECRIRIHSEIWLHAFKKGFQPCDNGYYLQKYLSEEQGEKWITLWIPHWARTDISHLMPINGISKLSLSWPGAGFKCFRTVEAPVNSVLVQHKNNLAWSYPWDETNCILVEPLNEIVGIETALQREDLYDIYLAGVQNVDKYRVSNYINNYILKVINKA